jgi:hypothetical protein
MPQVSYTETNYTQTNENARSIMKAIGLSNIGAIEIGNEPNEYDGHNGPSATE